MGPTLINYLNKKLREYNLVLIERLNNIIDTIIKLVYE